MYQKGVFVMGNTIVLKSKFLREKSFHKTLSILLIVSIVIMALCVIAMIASYIEAVEFVDAIIDTQVANKETPLSDAERKVAIGDRCSLATTISSIILAISTISLIFLIFYTDHRRKLYLKSECELKDCTENKENLYD